MLNGNKIYIDPMDLRDTPIGSKQAIKKPVDTVDTDDKYEIEKKEPKLEKGQKESSEIKDKIEDNNKEKVDSKNESERIQRPKNLKNDSQNKTKLDGLVNKTDHVLLKVSNIVPVLTSDIVIDSSKVSVVYRPFPFSERIHSISVKDITDVYIETVPFFATLNIVDTGFVENLVKITWLHKSDAEKARRIITGLMQANKENVDLKLVQDKELGAKLEEIGKVRDSKTTVSNSASIS